MTLILAFPLLLDIHTYIISSVNALSSSVHVCVHSATYNACLLCINMRGFVIDYNLVMPLLFLVK